MRYLLPTLGWLLLAPFMVWADDPVDYDVMIDISGSMYGFYAHNKNKSWRQFMQRFDSDELKTKFIFDTQFTRCEKASLWVCSKPGKDDTDLGGALSNWLLASTSGDAVFIITDNVADTGLNTKAQEQFYDLVSRGNNFSHVAIFVVSLPFNGKVHKIGADWEYKRYSGPRALSIYILLRDGDSRKFNRLKKTIAKKLYKLEHDLIQIKPFESNFVAGRLIEGLKVATNDSNQVRLVENSDDKKRPSYLFVQGLKLNRSVKFSFGVNIKSSNSFELRNVRLIPVLHLYTNDDRIRHLKIKENFTVKVTPDRATLYPDKLEGIQVNVENEPFGFADLGLMEQLKFAMNNTVPVDGKIEIGFDVPKENMELSQGLAEKWSYNGDMDKLHEATPAIQNKVFRLNQLVKRMLPEHQEDTTLYEIPVTLELRYPIWIPVALVFFVFGAIGLVWFLINWLQQSRAYYLEDDMNNHAPLAAELFAPYAHYLGEDELVFKLIYLGAGFWVSTPYRLRSARFINAGDEIRVEKFDSDEEFSWWLREESRHAEHLEGEDDDWNFA